MSKKTFNWFAKTSASVVLEAELKALGQSAGPVSFRVFNTKLQQNKEVFMQTPTIIFMKGVVCSPVTLPPQVPVFQVRGHNAPLGAGPNGAWRAVASNNLVVQ